MRRTNIDAWKERRTRNSLGSFERNSEHRLLVLSTLDVCVLVQRSFGMLHGFETITILYVQDSEGKIYAEMRIPRFLTGPHLSISSRDPRREVLVVVQPYSNGNLRRFSRLPAQSRIVQSR